MALQYVLLRPNRETKAFLLLGIGVALLPVFDGAIYDWPEDEKKTLSDIIVAFNEHYGIEMSRDLLALFEDVRANIEVNPQTDCGLGRQSKPARSTPRHRKSCQAADHGDLHPSPEDV